MGTADAKDFEPKEVFQYWLQKSIDAHKRKGDGGVGEFFGKNIPSLFKVNEREVRLFELKPSPTKKRKR